MSEFTAKLTRKEEVARDTIAFHLKKPRGFQFKPGQYMDVFAGGDRHTFSIAAAPHEKEIIFATRMRKGSAFKKKLTGLKKDDRIKIKAPGGQFILPDETDTPVVFLVGGIGITPVRSMLRHLAHKRSPQEVYLLHSNRTREDAPWFDELKALKNPKYEFIPTMTQAQSNDWEGEEGYITLQMINKYLEKSEKALYYVVGPPGFVDAMMTMLTQEKISRRNIVSEEFSGY